MNLQQNKGEIVIYHNQDGNIKIDVRLEDETVWLKQAHLCKLFQKSKSTISEHIKNIFKEGELEENSVVRKFRTTAQDGKTYDTQFYKGGHADVLNLSTYFFFTP